MDKETEIKLIRRIQLWKHNQLLGSNPTAVCVLFCLEIEEMSPKQISYYLRCESSANLQCSATKNLVKFGWINERIVNEVLVKKRFSMNPKGKAFLEKAKLLESDLLEAREKMFQKNKNG